MAVARNINRDTVLVALGLTLPKKLALGRDALKKLIGDKVLLLAGVINVGHPLVSAWLKTNGKKTR